MDTLDIHSHYRWSNGTGATEIKHIGHSNSRTKRLDCTSTPGSFATPRGVDAVMVIAIRQSNQSAGQLRCQRRSIVAPLNATRTVAVSFAGARRNSSGGLRTLGDSPSAYSRLCPGVCQRKPGA